MPHLERWLIQLWFINELFLDSTTLIQNVFLFEHTACMQRLSSPNAASLSSPDLNSSDVTPTSSCSTGKKSKSSYTDVTSSASSEKTYTLKGTRLIVLHNFQGKAFDDLPVRPGEYVYANLKDQIVPGFIWAYSPSSKKSGFIPEDHVKEPVVTDIWRIVRGSQSLVSPHHWRKRQMYRVAFVTWRWKECS